MIKARIPAQNPDANLKPYETSYKTFSWAEAEGQFTWSETGKINITYEAIDRWADKPDTSNKKAFIFDYKGHITSYTYAEVKVMVCQWAALLTYYGFNTGDRLFIYLPPCPEIYFVILACSRLGVIFTPLYQTLGYEELEERIGNAEPRGIITHPDLAERLPVEAMGMVENIFFIEGPLPGLFTGEVSVKDLISQMPKTLEPAWVKAETALYMIYSSGSTGPPKGVIHAHRDMLGHMITAKNVLDIREDSILWTDADPAWVTGTAYGVFAPLLCGATSVIQADPFSSSTWYRTLEKHKISVWYTTPLTIMRLMETGEDLPTRYDLSFLRHIATVGKSLTPEQFYWVKKNMRLSPHDTFWMTETGMICLANFPSMDIKPGSMGKPVPGVKAAVLDENGMPLPFLSMGELAIKTDWPCLMTGLWNDMERYRSYFRFEGWFMTGDMAFMDEEGYFYHQGRIDDLIKVGEKLIGPYEIEHTLQQHPSVLESAVISKGSHNNGPILKAFITPARGVTPSARLNREIRAFVKGNISSEVPLNEIEFIQRLPKTSSGKLLRRVLRARELGLPDGNPLEMKD
ncbi:Acetyl-coenzyme A synthetase [uncultured Desulfobacterium sp.]|uniref:acetate--CoA ligase n=1 Tax=uncultured Desulfobacterium sp. TaxID=201089 RepID=A0A445MV62_9BACT|nr:Acetyl-coenzyme A synthetase [uncultured Desulfobacterium sp.]